MEPEKSSLQICVVKSQFYRFLKDVHIEILAFQGAREPLHVHFGVASMLVGLKSALTKPSGAHFELFDSQFGLHFQPQ